MRMKAGNSGKEYGVLIKFIIRVQIKSELLNHDREEDIIISRKDLKKMLQKLPHWKALEKLGYRILDKIF